MSRVLQLKLLFRLRPFDIRSQEGREQERHRRALLTTMASMVAKGIAVTTSLISIPLTLDYLGTERFGIWMTISSIAAMLAFADFGIGNGLLSAISEASGKDDRKAMRSLIASAYFALSGVALSIFMLFLVLYNAVDWPSLLNVKSDGVAQETKLALVTFVGCFVFGIPLSIVQRVQLGLQKGFINYIWQSVGSLAALLAVLTAIRTESSLSGLVLALIGTPLVIAAANTVVFFTVYERDLKPKLRYVSESAIRRLINTGLLFLILQVAVAIAYSSDNIILARLLGPEAVTQYAVPAKMFSVVTMLLSMALLPLWPAYGEALARGDSVWINKTLVRSLKIAMTVSGLVAFGLFLIGPDLLKNWVGSQIVPSRLLLLGLAVWAVMDAVGNALAMYLNGLHVVRLQVVVASIFALGNLGLKVILVREMGGAGVIWATVISYGVLVLVPYAYFIPKAAKKFAYV